MSSPEILFRDRRYLVINKPAGMAVHASRAGGGNIEDYFAGWRLGKGGPWLAHRLDRDTAGCLVVALKKSALIAAQGLFVNGGVEKVYWTVVAGQLKENAGEIDLPLAKISIAKNWKMAPDALAPPAVTAWRVLGSGSGISWLECRPRTGRTHQIRAHCAALGHPIMGDAVYGGGGEPMALLARSIALPLEPPVAATAPVPSHMKAMLKTCGWNESLAP